MASHKYILTELAKLCNVPVLSEEDVAEIDVLEGYCFVVDPLRWNQVLYFRSRRFLREYWITERW